MYTYQPTTLLSQTRSLSIAQKLPDSHLTPMPLLARQGYLVPLKASSKGDRRQTQHRNPPNPPTSSAKHRNPDTLNPKPQTLDPKP